jgi:hypothetical protein
VLAGIGRARGGEPGIDDPVAHGQRQGDAPVLDMGVFGILAERIFEVVQKAFAQVGVCHGSVPCRWRQSSFGSDEYGLGRPKRFQPILSRIASYLRNPNDRNFAYRRGKQARLRDCVAHATFRSANGFQLQRNALEGAKDDLPEARNG